MTRPAVKFCGMCRREDAWMAADLGAAAIGFVFWAESPRLIRPDAARAIARTLPALVTTVGVFVNAPLDEVRETAAHVGLNLVQLHGEEGPEYASQLSGRVLKAVAGSTDDLLRAAAPWPPEVTLLVDAIDAARRGGTGRVADWSAAAVLARQRAIVLAGGLTPDNVAKAVHEVQPYAVDVASGVEREPGVKDRARMRAFMDAVTRAGVRPDMPESPVRMGRPGTGMPESNA
jgi:phosphoribosylanthranilate isomerase